VKHQKRNAVKDSIMGEIDLGWGRKPLAEQLAGMKFEPGAIEHAEKDADAVLRLHLRSLITTSMREHAMTRLIRRLEKARQR
jgi:hypothetical protein